MCHCTFSTGIIVTSCVYSFPTDKIFSLFRKVQFSVSYFIYLFYNVSFFSSFSERSKYVQNRINRYGRNAICACSAYACINVWIFSREFLKTQSMRLRFSSLSASLYRILRFYEKCFPTTNHLTELDYEQSLFPLRDIRGKRTSKRASTKSPAALKRDAPVEPLV